LRHASTVKDAAVPWVEHPLQSEFSAALLDTIGAIVCVADADGRIARLNRAGEVLSGYTVAEISDVPFWDILVPPEEVERVKAFFRHVVERHLPSEWENHWITKGGARRLIRWSNTVLCDGDHFAGIIGSGIDITDRRRAEEERDRLLAEERRARAHAERAERRAAFLAEAGPVLARAVVDEDAVLSALVHHAVPFLSDWCAVRVRGDDGIVWTRAFAHVDPEKEACLSSILPFPVHSPDGGIRAVPQGLPVVVNGREASLASVVATAPAEPELRATVLEILRVAGFTSYMAIPLAARGRLLGAVILGAASDERTFGPEDRVLAEALAERAALAVDNARLYRRMEQAVQAREEFLLVASHELRTPLTSLQISVQALLAHAREAGAGPPWGATLLATVHRSTGRLAWLVEDILDISRLTAGAPAPELAEVDLAVLVSEVVETQASTLRGAGCAVRVSVQGPTVGRWDRRWLLRVVAHLVGNAAKYGAGRPIEISLDGGSEAQAARPNVGASVGDRGAAGLDRRARAPSGAGPARVLRLTVRDHGIGIAVEEQARIFERFERGVPVRHYGGMGLGLWLVRRMVDALGGQIHVESRPGEGASFVLDLPTAGPCP
jgi:PAS domain S-box-containing protein